MTHKQLDDLFRANSRRGDFEPQPGEGEEMTGMLDAADRRELIGKWVSGAWMLTFAGLIVLGIGGIVRYGSAGATLSTVVSEHVVTPQGVTPSRSSRESVSSPNAAHVATTATITTATLADYQKQTASAEQLDGRAIPPHASVTNDPAEVRAQESLPATLIPPFADADEEPALPSTGAMEETAPAVTRVPSLNEPLAIRTELDSEALGQNITDPLDLLPLHALPTVTAHPPIPQLRDRRAPLQWSVGATVAREITSVDLHRVTDRGTRFGLTAHVMPWRRWSLDLGIAYAAKDFEAFDATYNPEVNGHAGYWEPADGHHAQHASAIVRTWEFPVSATYFLHGRDRSSVYGQVGLTAYAITREEVSYRYADGVDTEHVHDDLSDFNRFEPLGYMQAQLGWRHAKARGPAWRIGPYVQVPINGVGVGGVNLYTGGIQFELEVGR